MNRPASAPQEAPNAAIDVRGLSKSFGSKVAVASVDLHVDRGEIFGFLGPNGSGKTTTIRMLCGLLTPDDGHGTCLGMDLRTDARRIQRQVGYMTQKFSLYEDLTIRENLSFVAQVYGMKQRRQKVDAAVERLGLGHRQHQLASSLSGGWKQRLALAACMLHEPQLLLLDEPTAGVDPAARRDFWEEIHHLAHDGVTVLVSTHYMDEAERCTRLAYIAYGHLLADGTPQSLIRDSALQTWELEADEAVAYAHALRDLSGVEQVIPMGNRLRISGRDGPSLERELTTFASHQPHVKLTPSDTRLEDVFIQLMSQSEDQR